MSENRNPLDNKSTDDCLLHHFCALPKDEHLALMLRINKVLEEKIIPRAMRAINVQIIPCKKAGTLGKKKRGFRPTIFVLKSQSGRSSSAKA